MVTGISVPELGLRRVKPTTHFHIGPMSKIFGATPYCPIRLHVENAGIGQSQYKGKTLDMNLKGARFESRLEH
jgi:hypothetical protein